MKKLKMKLKFLSILRMPKVQLKKQKKNRLVGNSRPLSQVVSSQQLLKMKKLKDLTLSMTVTTMNKESTFGVTRAKIGISIMMKIRRHMN
jgi:hypothetical protein